MLRQLALVVLTGAAYAALGHIGLAFAVFHDNVSHIGPAAGLALAAVWLAGLPAALGVLGGAFALHVAVGAQPLVAMGLALASTLGAAVAVWLLRGVLRFDPALGRVRDVVSLVVAGACAAAVLAATIGSATLFLGDHASSGHPMELWLTWWAGDIQGILFVAPCVLGWTRCRAWDKADRLGAAFMQANGVQHTVASPAFTEQMRAKTSELERKWMADAKAKGLANPEQVIREYRAEIAKLQ